MLKVQESLKSSLNFPRNIRESFYVFVFLIQFCNYFVRRCTTSQISKRNRFSYFLTEPRNLPEFENCSNYRLLYIGRPREVVENAHNYGGSYIFDMSSSWIVWFLLHSPSKLKNPRQRPSNIIPWEQKS